jgi:ATP-dependent Clp protease ATP-binding subunit ClpA
MSFETKTVSAFGRAARRCFFFAQCEASSFARNDISLNHLLLGVLRQRPTLIPRSALEDAVAAIETEEVGRCRQVPVPVSHTDCMKRLSAARSSEPGAQVAEVLSDATEMARSAGRKVEPSDLIAAILLRTDSVAARLLRKYSADRAPDTR